MLNFIVAKALAKDLEHRYQNAKDLANDLRACRDTVPRSAAVIQRDAADTIAAKPVLDAIPAIVESDDEPNQVLTMRLSPSFDSVGATMRLAAMTATQEEVDELSRTFKMARPSIEEINRAAPQPKALSNPSQGNVARPPVETRDAKSGGLLLFAVIALILIGLISAFLF